MRPLIALAVCLLSALPALANPNGISPAAVMAADDELAGGRIERSPAPIETSEAAPPPGQEILIDDLTGAEIVGPAPLNPYTEQTPPRRFLTWAGREAPRQTVSLRGRSD